MVFQSYALYPTMTVADNIGFALEMRKVPKPQRLQRIQEVATMLQISHLLERRPAQLSPYTSRPSRPNVHASAARAAPARVTRSPS